MLGVENRGLLAIVLFAGQFIPHIALLGFSDAVVSTAQSGKNIRVVKANAIALAAANCAFIFLAFAIPVFFYLSSYEKLVAVWGVIFFSVQLLDVVLTQLLSGALRATGRYATFDAFRISLPLLYAASMLTLFFVAPSALLFVKLNIVCVVLIAATKLLALIRLIDFTSVAPSFGRRAISYFLINIGFVFSSQLDRLFVVSFMSERDVGLFIAAATVAGPFQSFLTQAMRTIVMPSFAGRSFEEKVVALRDGLSTVWILSVVSATVVAISGPVIVLLVFGPEFERAALLVPLLSFAVVLAPIRGLIIEVLKTEAKSKHVYFIELVYIVVFCLTFVLAKEFEVSWPVLPAFLLANILSAFFAAKAASQVYGFSPYSWLRLDWRPISQIVRRLISGEKT